MLGTVSSPKRCGLVAGVVLLVIHSVLALFLFLYIHFVRSAQAEMAWTHFRLIDMGLVDLVWNTFASTEPFVALFQWAYERGVSPNLRAFAIYGLFGGIEWFTIGYVVGFLFWPKRGYLAHWKHSEKKSQAQID